MTEAILLCGCDIQDTVGYSAKANVLFEMCYYWPMEQTQPWMPAKALDFLIGIGYELEQFNQEGQTPLLWTASAYQPQVIKCLKVFIYRGANLQVTDRDGRGALHCAFLVPHILDDWKSLRLISQGLHVSKFYYLPSHVYLTEDTAHAGDYHHDSLEPNRLKDTSSPTERRMFLSGTQKPTEQPQLNGPKELSPQAVNTPNAYKASPSEQIPAGFVLCKDLDGNEHRIQDPINVLKNRLKFKLLTLLNAGCDPNILDNEGRTPSDYARGDGLWPQWFWALETSHYVYECREDRWIRRRQMK